VSFEDKRLQAWTAEPAALLLPRPGRADLQALARRGLGSRRRETFRHPPVVADDRASTITSEQSLHAERERDGLRIGAGRSLPRTNDDCPGLAANLHVFIAAGIEP
jgi:hypothetical protein